MEDSRILINRYVSPCGQVSLGSCGDSLCLCDWINGRHEGQVVGILQKAFGKCVVVGKSLIIEQAMAQLDEYFSGRRREFDIPLRFVGTEFQKAVWRSLLAVPYGATLSYGDVAERIGRPTATRAVANAIGANVMSILVPCHRVVGKRGALGGYAGGVSAKKFLLEFEARNRYGVGNEK